MVATTAQGEETNQALVYDDYAYGGVTHSWGGDRSLVFYACQEIEDTVNIMIVQDWL